MQLSGRLLLYDICFYLLLQVFNILNTHVGETMQICWHDENIAASNKNTKSIFPFCFIIIIPSANLAETVSVAMKVRANYK